MDSHTNTSNECERVAELVDHYVSGELGDADLDVVERHLERCAACADEVAQIDAARAQLRAALARDPHAPDLLLAQVRTSVRAEVARSRQNRVFRFAAAAAVAIAASAVAWSAHDASPAPLAPTATSSANDASAPVLRVGLDHHLHCSRALPTPERALAPEAIDAKLGAGYAGLAESVTARLGPGLTLVDAHLCGSEGRRYVHLILRGAGPTVSVLATRRDAALTDVPSDAALDERGARSAAYAGPAFMVFVVSGDPSVDPSAIAASLGPLVGPVAPPARA